MKFDLALALDPAILSAGMVVLPRHANKAANHFLYQVMVWMLTCVKFGSMDHTLLQQKFKTSLLFKLGAVVRTCTAGG